MRFVTLWRGAVLAAVLLQIAGWTGLAQAQQTGAGDSANIPFHPYRSGANPNADPNKSLKSCMDHAGMNLLERDRCMRRHCVGHWGEGDCPASGGDLFSTQRTASSTPLGQCLAQAGANPFKRTACGWKHCRSNWDTPECAVFKARRGPGN